MILRWLKNLLWWHKWEYRNPYHRTCTVCDRTEVEYCSDMDDFFCTVSCWWEVYNEGDKLKHKTNGKEAP